MKKREEFDGEIGKRVEQYRKANDYTQEALAKKVYVSASAISRLEKGKQLVSVPTMMRIAETLGVTVDDLLYGSKEVMTTDDEWDQKIIILLEKYSPKQKERIWKIMKEMRGMMTNEE